MALKTFQVVSSYFRDIPLAPLGRSIFTVYAPVAQRIRAPVFGTGCRRFESVLGYKIRA